MDVPTIQEFIDVWLINQDPNEWLYIRGIGDEKMPQIPQGVRGLEIRDCPNLKYIQKMEGLRFIHIYDSPVEEIDIPSSLRNLYLENTNMTYLFDLPDSLRTLYVYNMKNATNIELSSFPIGLRDLTLRNLEISSLPNLPNGLLTLDLQECKIQRLPRLPDSILYLDTSSTTVTNLDDLPEFLEELHIQNSCLSSLPELPSTLEVLNCSMSVLCEIPRLPLELKELYCASMPFLKKLPGLPYGMTILSAYENQQLSCLPYLPSTLKELYVDGTGIVLLNNLPPSLEVVNMYNCPNLLISIGKGESLADYNARCNSFFQEKAVSACKMIKDELLDVTWGPDNIMKYVNKYGREILADI
jgi:hypothetical protein